MSTREISVLRRRHADLEDDADAQPGIAVNCTPVIAVVTYTKVSYPSAAASFYACHPIAISGSETEGGTVNTTTDTTQTLYVANLGSTLIPVGTKILATAVAGRWECIYNG